jgi:hypothetical protein
LSLEKAGGATNDTDFQWFRKNAPFTLWVKEKTEVYFRKLFHPWLNGLPKLGLNFFILPIL